MKKVNGKNIPFPESNLSAGFLCMCHQKDMLELGTTDYYVHEVRPSHLTLCRNLLGCKQYLSKLKDMEALQMLETLYGINVTVCKCCGGHLGKPQQRIPLRI